MLADALYQKKGSNHCPTNIQIPIRNADECNYYRLKYLSRMLLEKEFLFFYESFMNAHNVYLFLEIDPDI